MFCATIYFIVKTLVPSTRKSEPKIKVGMDRDGDLMIQVIDEVDGTQMAFTHIRIKHTDYVAMGVRRGYNKIGTRSSGDFWKVFLELESKNSITKDDVMRNYKRLAMQYHPDKPSGSQDLMKMLNRAKDEALKVAK